MGRRNGQREGTEGRSIGKGQREWAVERGRGIKGQREGAEGRGRGKVQRERAKGRCRGKGQREEEMD